MRRILRQMLIGPRLAGGGGEGFPMSLFSVPASAAHEIGLFREDYNSSEALWLCQHLGNGRYWAIALHSETSAGSATLHQLTYMQIRVPMQSLEDDDATYIVRSGAGWTTGLASAGAYGADYSRTSTVGDSITFTTPANARHIGVRTLAATNGGINKVLIDGDATLANLLSTAQQLVDAGTLASTALVANGGTLNPTDRVINQYVPSSNGDPKVMIAQGLTPGVHTLTLICTGYKQAESTDARLYVSGFMYSATTTNLSTANILMQKIADLETSGASVYEYARQYKPDGATANDFYGNGHGYDRQQSLAVAVDGASQSLSDGQIVGGVTDVAVVRVSKLRHPDTSTTDIADVTTTYTMRPDTGLTVAHTTTWLVNGQMNRDYPVMAPFGELLNKATLAGAGADYDMDNASGDATEEFGFVESAIGWAWDSDGRYAYMCHVPDVATTLNNWQYSEDVDAFVQDRTGALINKFYWARSKTLASGEPFAINDVWRSEANYRVAWLADANASLAGKS